MSAALTFEGVGKVFADGTDALAGLEFHLDHGTFTAVVGPSGGGKTTLLRLAAGLLAPTAGQVIRTLATPGPGAIGYVFQDPTLMPWADVRANVRLPLKLTRMPRREADARVANALALVGLDAFADRYPLQLSGGMRMRVAIARALVTEPSLLLLDEPFAALDEITRFRLNDELLRLWQLRRCTVLFVTHSVGEAVYLAERILVLSPRPGRVVTDIAVALPQPRSAALRTSRPFEDLSAAVSRALVEAIQA
ncbi:MAG: ABC transporter ATP-binding protein [Defluviicoccus sp.]|nr:ABC transporter ATP-binding protein [Defluviicoccus sp.]MDG4608936.1 ABC transporter ATP-binding protein [Defluviicoccus sp.]